MLNPFRGSRLPNFSSLIVLSVSVVLLGAGLPQIQADIIGISLDTVCKKQIKNNFDTTCPSYEELNLIYPDHFCNFKGSKCIDYFQQTGVNDAYILDPDRETRQRIKTIEIRSNFDEYLLKGIEGYDDINHTLKYNIGTYTSRGTTYIDADRWFTLLGQVIWWLDGGGENPHKVRYENINQTEHDISTSYKWQLEKWIEASKEKCKSKCFEY